MNKALNLWSMYTYKQWCIWWNRDTTCALQNAPHSCYSVTVSVSRLSLFSFVFCFTAHFLISTRLSGEHVTGGKSLYIAFCNRGKKPIYCFLNLLSHHCLSNCNCIRQVLVWNNSTHGSFCININLSILMINSEPLLFSDHFCLLCRVAREREREGWELLSIMIILYYPLSFRFFDFLLCCIL